VRTLLAIVRCRTARAAVLVAFACALPVRVFAQVVVTVSPPSANLSPGESQQFTATVSDASDASVTWTILEGASGGTISSAGAYQAPGALGIYHVVATSNANSQASAIATVALPGFVQTGLINPNPCTATLLANNTVLYAGGGLPRSNSAASPAEIYDPASFTSAATGSMTIARCFETATLLSNGQVLFAGGQSAGAATATAEIYDPVAGTFTAIGSMNFARQGHTATLLLDGTVLIAGGTGNCGGTACALNTAELYIPSSGAFQSIATTLSAAYTGANAVLLKDGTVLIAGGGSTFAEVYDPSTEVFTQVGAMVTPRVSCTATLLPDGTVLFAGGAAGGALVAAAEIYDPPSRTFTATGSLNFPRDLHAAMLLSTGQVLIAGGNAGSNAAELFNPQNGTFTVTGALSETRWSPLATALPSGTVLIAGGHFIQSLGSIESYDPNAGTFSSRSTFLNVTRTGHATTQLADGRLLLTGGQDAGLDVNSSAEIFDPATGAFTLTGALNQGRYGHTATLLSDGTVLVVGGFIEQNATQIAATAEIYNPNTGQFAPAPAGPNLPRADHTATLLSNGQVLIAGGLTGVQQTTSSTELYDPVAGAFTPAANMDAPRYNHTATVLNDGRVFLADGVSGGEGGGAQAAPDDIYDPTSGLFTPVGRPGPLQNVAVMPIDSVLLANGQVLADNDTIFDPTSNTLAPINSPVNFVDASLQDYEFALLPSNQVFATSNSYPTYLFDPIAETFSASASLQYFRSSPTVHLLPSGQVLIAGGAGVAQAEFYVPPVATSGSAPSLSSLNPSAAVAGGAGFTLAVTGSNFASGSVVDFNGLPRQTTFVGSTELTVAVTASDILNPGTATITVTNPTSGTSPGGTSNALTLAIVTANGQPVVGGLVPSSATAGGAGFTLSVTGNDFSPISVVTFNRTAVPFTFVSATQLQASIPASAIAVAGTPLVTVSNPGSSPSVAISFTVNNPVPAATVLSPPSVLVGSAAVTLTVSGNNFNASSSILLNGSAAPTRFVSATNLQTPLPASDFANPGTFDISVNNPAPGGGASSALTLSVSNPPNPAPQAESLLPSSVAAGGSAPAPVLLDVNGVNFNSSSSILLNGTAVQTKFVSVILLQTTIPASNLATGGILNIAVSNPAPGGGTTPPLVFTVNDYSLTSLTAATTVTAGTPATFTLTLAPTNESFGNQVTFTAVAASLPANTTATFAPNSITPNSVTQTVTLTITTTAHTLDSWLPRNNWPSLLLVMLAAMAIAQPWICLRACRLQRRRLVPRVVLLFLLLAASGGLAACSGGYVAPAAPQLDPTTGTPAGTYTILVTATSGGISHSTSLTLTVM
jgi:hypothetical protein